MVADHGTYRPERGFFQPSAIGVVGGRKLHRRGGFEVVHRQWHPDSTPQVCHDCTHNPSTTARAVVSFWRVDARAHRGYAERHRTAIVQIVRRTEFSGYRIAHVHGHGSTADKRVFSPTEGQLLAVSSNPAPQANKARVPPNRQQLRRSGSSPLGSEPPCGVAAGSARRDRTTARRVWYVRPSA